MKNLILTFFSILLTTALYSQDIKDAKQESTKMDVFASKTGVIMKFVDYTLPDLKVSYGVAETRVRKLLSEGQTMYFYQISKKGQYDTKTASIAYEDLLEVMKAYTSLKSEAEKDLVSNPDYLENKFVTDDGFKLGYYINNGKITWYLVLEKYGSGNTIYIKDISDLDSALNGAKQKIEELKNMS